MDARCLGLAGDPGAKSYTGSQWYLLSTHRITTVPGPGSSVVGPVSAPMSSWAVPDLTYPMPKAEPCKLPCTVVFFLALRTVIKHIKE